MRKRISLYLSFFALLCGASLNAAAQSYSAESSTLGEIASKAEGVEKTELQKWREDLQFIKEEFPNKHKDLFHRLDRDLSIPRSKNWTNSCRR